MRKIYLMAASIAVSFTGFAQVGIGTSTPHASAALDVESTTKGFLLPRMTKLQMETIAVPAEGLVVYCLDCRPKGVYVFDGINFVSMVTNLPSEFIFEDVISSTGKTWMDRNLGASRVATASADESAYGDLYQWGRAADGHQLRTSSVTTGPVAAGTEGSNFIIAENQNWLTVQDDTRWQSATESNNPCPTGYRIPTEAELANEILMFTSPNAAGAFASVLKLPVAGGRYHNDSTFGAVGTGGYYWTSTVSSGANARNFVFDSNETTMNSYYRANGFSVRCIKD